MNNDTIKKPTNGEDSTPPDGPKPAWGGLDEIEAELDRLSQTLMQEIGPERVKEQFGEISKLPLHFRQFRFTDLEKVQEELAGLLPHWKEGLRFNPEVEEQLARALSTLMTPDVKKRLKGMLYEELSRCEEEAVTERLAIANVSLDVLEPRENPFLRAMFQLSVIERWQREAREAALAVLKHAREFPAGPALIEAVGPELAEGVAQTPLLLHLIDIDRVRLRSEEFEKEALDFLDLIESMEEQGLDSETKKSRQEMAVSDALARIWTEADREEVVSQLHRLQQWANKGDPALAEQLNPLIEAALASFEKLPPGRNPFCQALWTVSVDRFVEEL